jgi:tRNA threonylcarbamoyl adenosine modification protein YeaZ
MTLYLDTTSSFLYTAIIEDDKVIAEIKEHLGNNLSEYTLPRIEEMLNVKGISPDEINKIIVVNGPGSFTGIRIGLTIAKTLAWAKNISIIPISSLEAMALSADGDYDYVVPAIDARRNYLYASIYDIKNNSFVMNERYVSTDTLNVALDSMIGDICFITNDVIEAKYDIQPYDPKIELIVNMVKDRPSVNPHSIDANYLKMTEAEEKKMSEDKND